jgi:hypothetical protein
MGAAKRVGPQADHILETEIDGDISLYDPQTEQVMVLNQTASDIWLLSDGEHSVTQIVVLLANAYAVKPEAIRGEVEATVASFVESGFLKDGDEG